MALDRWEWQEDDPPPRNVHVLTLDRVNVTSYGKTRSLEMSLREGYEEGGYPGLAGGSDLGSKASFSGVGGAECERTHGVGCTLEGSRDTATGPAVRQPSPRTGKGRKPLSPGPRREEPQPTPPFQSLVPRR